MLLRFSRSHTVKRCVSAAQRVYQQRVECDPLRGDELNRLRMLVDEHAPFLRPAVDAVVVENFNFPTTTNAKQKVLQRMMQAVAAKGIAYPLVNGPHLLGPLFVKLGDNQGF